MVPKYLPSQGMGTNWLDQDKVTLQFDFCYPVGALLSLEFTFANSLLLLLPLRTLPGDPCHTMQGLQKAPLHFQWHHMQNGTFLPRVNASVPKGDLMTSFFLKPLSHSQIHFSFSFSFSSGSSFPLKILKHCLTKSPDNPRIICSVAYLKPPCPRISNRNLWLHTSNTWS